MLTFLLRAYKIGDFFYFTYDESIPAFVGRNLVLWHRVPLIGGVTPFGFHLAPYFYWLLATVLFFGTLNPIAWGWAGAIISMLTTLMMYLVGKKFFNKKVGFLAASLWAFSYLTNVYDRHFWALYWGPLVSLVTLYSLNKIISGKYKYIFLLAITFAFAIHADLSNLLFLVLSAIILIIYKISIKKEFFFASLLIVASFIPLIIFEARHNFANSRQALSYFKKGRDHAVVNPQGFIHNSLLFPITFARLIYPPGDNEIAKNYSYCPVYTNQKYQSVPLYAIGVAATLILGFLIYSLDKNSRYKLLSLLLLLYYFSIQAFGTLFKSDIFEHYLSGLFPALLLILAIFISKLPKKVWLMILAIFITVNLYKLSLTQNSLGLKYKREAIEYTMLKVGDQDFSLDSLSTCWKYSGYRYLFTLFGREPIKSYVDPNFAHLYGPTPIASHHPATVVSFVFHDFVPETQDFYRKYNLIKSHQTSSAYFGKLEVVVIDNSSGWFD